MSELILDKNFIKNHIDKKFYENYLKSDKLIDLDKLEKLYKKTLTFIRKLSKGKHVQFMMAFSKHKFDIEKVQILTQLFFKFDNKKTNKNNKPIKDQFKKFEPKIEGTYRCFGDYKVIHEIGSGAFGTVYLVEKDNKKYAIKTQHINFNNVWLTPNQHMKQIKNEIDITKKMGDMDIGPKLYDYYICQPDMNKISIFMVMELMTEGSLNNWLQNNKLTKAQENNIVNKIEKMHKAGIVHADIQDHNILVTKRKSKIEFYIGDFGISKTVENLIKETKEFDIIQLEHISKNNSMLHPYIAKLFILCNLI